MADTANILLIEDISTVRFFIRTALEALPRPHALRTAASLGEAREILAGQRVDLLIVDIGLPDGDGIDFLCEAAQSQPQAAAIVITASPSDENRSRAGQLGIVEVLGKPVDRDTLNAAVARRLGWTSEPHTAPNFRATLSGLTMMDIIQLKCMSGSTSILEFSNGGGSGRVHFEKGNVVHAAVRTGAGESKIGYEAFEEIVSWKSGRVAEVQEDNPCPRTIRTDWQSLLLEVAQSRDEMEGRAA